jgi:hypothetical protein
VPTPYIDASLANESFATVARRLREEVTTAEPRLRSLDEERAGRAPAPGKWSPQQVLGHLVDSAANNHQRFVRAQQGPLDLPGYAQEHWVASQAYDQRAWSEVVTLWAAYNRHLAHVLERIPPALADVPCTIGGNPPEALVDVARDYVGHLRHHLRQIFGP